MLKKLKYFLRYIFISDEKYIKYKFKKYLKLIIQKVLMKNYNG